jgi:hypothetical protein
MLDSIVIVEMASCAGFLLTGTSTPVEVDGTLELVRERSFGNGRR